MNCLTACWQDTSLHTLLSAIPILTFSYRQPSVSSDVRALQFTRRIPKANLPQPKQLTDCIMVIVLRRPMR